MSTFFTASSVQVSLLFQYSSQFVSLIMMLHGTCGVFYIVLYLRSLIVGINFVLNY
jgi:hypothetical protein